MDSSLIESSLSSLTISLVEFRTFETKSPIEFKLNSSFEFFNRVEFELGFVWT